MSSQRPSESAWNRLTFYASYEHHWGIQGFFLQLQSIPEGNLLQMEVAVNPIKIVAFLTNKCVIYINVRQEEFCIYEQMDFFEALLWQWLFF